MVGLCIDGHILVTLPAGVNRAWTTMHTITDYQLYSLQNHHHSSPFGFGYIYGTGPLSSGELQTVSSLKTWINGDHLRKTAQEIEKGRSPKKRIHSRNWECVLPQSKLRKIAQKTENWKWECYQNGEDHPGNWEWECSSHSLLNFLGDLLHSQTFGQSCQFNDIPHMQPMQTVRLWCNLSIAISCPKILGRTLAPFYTATITGIPSCHAWESYRTWTSNQSLIPCQPVNITCSNIYTHRKR